MPDTFPVQSTLTPTSAQSGLLRLSQGHLNLLETCPRKFQHVFLEQLGSPTSPEQQERQTWGSRFHLLMQQRELGLPIEALIQQDVQLQRWLTAFIQAAPDVLTLDTDGRSSLIRQSEHRRTLNFTTTEAQPKQNYLLTVVYDLLILDQQQAQILDWKTYPRPQDARWLAQDWQTRLYPYVLAETSDYLPEQISMTYWFVQGQQNESAVMPEPQSLRFPYSEALHAQTQQDLHCLLDQLTTWLQRYQSGEPFPQVNPAAGSCQACQFAIRCDRTSPEAESTSPDDWLSAIATIQEVPL